MEMTAKIMFFFWLLKNMSGFWSELLESWRDQGTFSRLLFFQLSAAVDYHIL